MYTAEVPAGIAAMHAFIAYVVNVSAGRHSREVIGVVESCDRGGVGKRIES